MPKPKDKETKEEFMKRCIPELINEGKEQDQAIAICNSIFDRTQKIKNGIMPKN